MYYLVTIKDTVRVPPALMGEEVEEAILQTLRKKYEGMFGDQGIILAVTRVKNVGAGKIHPGDPGIYYMTEFEALMYRPELKEVVVGEVVEITEFGAFIRIGPVDGLVHISQVTDDFMSYSKDGVLQGKQTRRTLKVGDVVIARIITISQKEVEGARVGLTMRQPGLGKLEWLEEERAKEKGG